MGKNLTRQSERRSRGDVWGALHIKHNVGALIIRSGFWGGSDRSLWRTKLQMTCASRECIAALELDT